MKFWDKQDKEIIYNFCIQYIYRKHNLHHENITTIKTIHAVITAEIQLYAFTIYVVIMVAQHHTKVEEQHFPFLHLHKNYNLFKTIYQALNKLNQ